MGFPVHCHLEVLMRRKLSNGLLRWESEALCIRRLQHGTLQACKDGRRPLPAATSLSGWAFSLKALGPPLLFYCHHQRGSTHTSGHGSPAPGKSQIPHPALLTPCPASPTFHSAASLQLLPHACSSLQMCPLSPSSSPLHRLVPGVRMPSLCLDKWFLHWSMCQSPGSLSHSISQPSLWPGTLP